MAASGVSSQSFYTELEYVKHLTDWTIENFPLLRRTTENGVEVGSPMIKIPITWKDGQPATTIWHMACFPAGRTPEDAGHVSLFVFLDSLGRPRAKTPIKAQVDLMLECDPGRMESRKAGFRIRIDLMRIRIRIQHFF
jgi:hypothetical protein